MKKMFVVLSLMLISVMAIGQNDSIMQADVYRHMDQAAGHFDKFAWQARLGIFAQCMGGIMVAGAYLNDEKPVKGLLIMGGATATAGIIIFIRSFDHISEGTKSLRRIKTASTGVGIAYSF